MTCGGLAGMATWISIFPLDVVKSRQQGMSTPSARSPMGAFTVAERAYKEEGASVFFRGLGVCSVRAFVRPILTTGSFTIILAN